jgi:adhesin transport system outer membrane protein
MNKFAKFCTVSALSLMISTAAFAAGEDGDLTLQDAVSKGVLKSPTYGVVANNKLATKEELSQAKALWAPSIDFLAEAGYEHTGHNATDESQFHKRASLTLTQLIFDGWGTPNEIKRQKFRTESAANRVGEVAEFVGLDIVEAYLEVLRQRDLLAISRANLEDHLKIEDTIRTGADAGTVTEGDVAQANSRVAQAKASIASTEEALRRAEALFVNKVGEVPADMEFPQIPKGALPANLEDAVRMAVTQSPTLAVFESDIKVAKAEYDASGSTLYPRVELQANAAYGHDINGIDGPESSQSVLGVMKWNLYRGGADYDRQREFMYRHAETKERRAESARQVEQEVRNTWAGMEAAHERARQFTAQAAANEKVVNVYLDQFALDRRTLLDVLDSQNELFVSRSNHVNALYTEMFAVFRIMALQGELLKTLNLPRPRESRVDNN